MHMGGGCKQGEEEEGRMIDYISAFSEDDRRQKD